MKVITRFMSDYKMYGPDSEEPHQNAANQIALKIGGAMRFRFVVVALSLGARTLSLITPLFFFVHMRNKKNKIT